MTGPVVLVTNNAEGYSIKVEWFETETDYYDGLVTLVAAFVEAKHGWWYEPKRTSSLALGTVAVKVIQEFERNPWTDVSRYATHTVAEPGAPLKPVEGRAA